MPWSVVEWLACYENGACQGLLGKEGSFRVADIGQPAVFDSIHVHPGPLARP